MKAKLIHSETNKKYYKLSEYISIGENKLLGKFSIPEEFEYFLKHRVKQEYIKDLTPILTDPRGTNIICISKALYHIETLVFPAFEYNSKFHFIGTNIGGIITYMSDGGDQNTILTDEEYLKELAMLNNYIWEEIITDKKNPYKVKIIENDCYPVLERHINNFFEQNPNINIIKIINKSIPTKQLCDKITHIVQIYYKEK